MKDFLDHCEAPPFYCATTAREICDNLTVVINIKFKTFALYAHVYTVTKNVYEIHKLCYYFIINILFSLDVLFDFFCFLLFLFGVLMV